jgi:uncharacterized protein with PQ loop repeat
MIPDLPHAAVADTKHWLRPVIGAMSVFTMAMTVPQAAVVWFRHETAGVSLLTWSAYLLSALIWPWYGISKRAKYVYLPRVGWIVLDGAIIAGGVLYG